LNRAVEMASTAIIPAKSTSRTLARPAVARADLQILLLNCNKTIHGKKLHQPIRAESFHHTCVQRFETKLLILCVLFKRSLLFRSGPLFRRSLPRRPALGLRYEGFYLRTAHQFSARHFHTLKPALLDELAYPLLGHSPDASRLRLRDPLLKISGLIAI
jgi:hypothetical protein